MGYQGQGAIRIVGPRDVLLGALARMVLTRKDLIKLDEALEEYRIVQHPTNAELVIVGLTYGSWKWYDSYPDIQAIEAIWSTLSAEEGVDAAFVRIGENDDDVDVRYIGDNAYELASVVRSVEADPMTGEDLRNVLSSKIDDQKTQGASDGSD